MSEEKNSVINDEQNPVKDDEFIIPDADNSNGEIQSGEYDDTSAPDDIDIVTGSSDTSSSLPVSALLRSVIHENLKIHLHLQRLEEKRQALLKDKEITKDTKNEIRRQQRETRRLPSREQATKNIKSLKNKLASIAERLYEEDEEVEPINEQMRSAYKIAFKQWNVCVQRNLDIEKLKLATNEIYCTEPLLLAFKHNGEDCETMFALSIYALALENLRLEQQLKNKELQKDLKQLNETATGIMKLLRHKKNDDGEKEKLNNVIAAHNSVIRALSNELADIENILVKEFWETYTVAAKLLLKSSISQEESNALRAMLRYGMISSAKWFLPENISEYILNDISDTITSITYSMSNTNVLYADECIELTAKGFITPAIDEDLELNKRLSPEWKEDKLHRKILSTKVRESVLNELIEELKVKIVKLRKNQKELEERKKKLLPGSRDFKHKQAQFSSDIQNCKVEAARYERAIDKIKKEILPRQLEIRSKSEKENANNNIKVTDEQRAEKEAKAMHRIARLCAKLKDPFPPFALRDNFKTDTGAINSREIMLEKFQQLESSDRTIFQEPLLTVKKENKRIYQRFSPVIILSPGCGFMGYSWSPRYGSEFGRMALPSYCPRPGIIDKIISTTVSDFRWDTSKASAGVDLLTSETIVAAYSNVRWEYRRKGRHIREKAGIYTEENDRQNFRRHYELYIQSAHDGGKKLFFKCLEAYEEFIIYIPLPHGVERLKK
jgi:hypothetical protein